MQDRRVLAQEALYNLGERQPMRSWRIPAVSLAVIATAASNSLYLYYGRDPRQAEW